MILFNAVYLIATEFISSDKSKAEALVFRPGHAPAHLQSQNDPEGGFLVINRLEVAQTNDTIHLPQQKDVFSWKAVNYDIPVKEGTRRLLADVNGWVKPGS